MNCTSRVSYFGLKGIILSRDTFDFYSINEDVYPELRGFIKFTKRSLSLHIFEIYLKHIQNRGYVNAKGHKITNVRPNYKVKILLFVCGKSILSRKISTSTFVTSKLSFTGPAGTIWGHKCLAHVEISHENEPLDTYHVKKNYIP